MKVRIDPSVCTGCGLCPTICPEVFAQENGVAGVVVETVPADAENACREAVESCPVEAISIED